MKKFIITFLLFITMSAAGVYANELYKICPVCFDISNSLIFIPVKAPASKSITSDIAFTKIDNVNGTALEINSAIVEPQPCDMFFSTGVLKEFQIIRQNQDTVKISMYFKDNFDLANLKIGNINNNIVIITTALLPYNMNYYINTYRDSGINPKDYSENLIITSSIDNLKSPSAPNTDQAKASVQINGTACSQSEINSAFLNIKPVSYADLTKDNTLRSKYYLDNITVKDELFQMTGYGTVSIQKAFILENPLRAVFDLPNTIINKDLHNKEFKLACGDKIKTAQFNANTSRIVVTSENAAKYIPVYFADSQSFLLTDPQNLMTNHLPEQKTNIVKTVSQKSNNSDNLIFEFDKPLCYAIKRTPDYLLIYFLNAAKYNEKNFQAAKRSTIYCESEISLMKNAGMRFSLPTDGLEDINTYISPEGRVFKISSQKTKPLVNTIKKADLDKLAQAEGEITAQPKYTSEENCKVVVIDAGHGGKDYGAIKNGVNEKDIDLDVAIRLRDILQKKGFTVYMTRTDDTYVSLEDRTSFTEGINPAVFVSIHVNSCNMESPKGIETHYYHENSIELGNCVHTELIKKISGTPNRGLLKSRFYVINHTTVPAILVEIGFISNPNECRELTTPQRKQAAAAGIAEGIIEYLNKRQK